MPDAKPARNARAFLPESRTLASLRRAAAGCRGCTLFVTANQTVFGSGRSEARFLLVGDQPSDDEDQTGRPFTGPAGRVLDEALEQIGLDRREVYLTNAVKHFKWAPKGARRLHRRPTGREIVACLPWLEAEIEAVRPELVVALGAAAARALLGQDFRMAKGRGVVVERTAGPPVVATVHPSSILRAPTSEERRRARTEFVSDLRRIVERTG